MMRGTLVLLVVLAGATAGCNALTGASDLELVDCIDCDADGGGVSKGDDATPPQDSARVDTTVPPDGSEPDASVGDAPSNDDGTSSETSDGASDADAAGDAADADAADAPKLCKGDLSCDDGDACTVDRCLFGTCSSSMVDLDGDGESPTTGACGPDCYDGNKAVFSKQTTYFTAPYTTAAGTVSFDYDCNGADEPQYTTLGKCTLLAGKCVLTAGWSGTVVPSCGKSAAWLTGCTPYFTGSCLPGTVTRVQSCR